MRVQEVSHVPFNVCAKVSKLTFLNYNVMYLCVKSLLVRGTKVMFYVSFFTVTFTLTRLVICRCIVDVVMEVHTKGF